MSKQMNHHLVKRSPLPPRMCEPFFFFFLIFYLFVCTGCKLWHVGSSSLTRD